jgi:predicted AlkP superfamily pyrophosphatase or phosphodiesterase
VKRTSTLALLLVLLAPRAVASDPPVGLVLVSIDGLAAEYLERFEAPHLVQLGADGVRARSLIPVFPTKTFPNHYTIVTGLWPEHHGIVSNTIYDPDLDATFRITDRDESTKTRWWGGEPLWVTLERQGKVAATMFWPGSDVEIRGVRPSFWRPYERSFPGAERIAEVLGWFDLPADERPAFTTLYFHDVDSAGHGFGPESAEVRDALATVDGHIGALLAGLAARDVLERVDVVVVSDHGMAALDHERLIVLDEHVDTEALHIVELSPVLGIHVPQEDAGQIGALVAKLDGIEHLSAWRREDLPERLHLRASPRTPSIVALADEGWRITRRKDLTSLWRLPAGGAHGYDPELASMHGVLLARGPSFRRGAVVDSFENVHLYELLAAVLGVEPAPNDGSLDVVRHLLRSDR